MQRKLHKASLSKYHDPRHSGITPDCWEQVKIRNSRDAEFGQLRIRLCTSKEARVDFFLTNQRIRLFTSREIL
jgi:hypothetical protein